MPNTLSYRHSFTRHLPERGLTPAFHFMITLILLGLLLVPFLVLGGGTAVFWKKRRRAILRWTAISYFIAVPVIFLGVVPYLLAWAVTHAGTRPPDMRLKETPAGNHVAYEEIIFDTKDALRLSGWFIPPASKNAILICTHGLFRNRVEALGRALAARQAGYGALLYDSRSHGASEKGIVSLGHYEKHDVLGAIQYIQRRYQDSPEHPQIFLFGISMGAVATLQAAAECKGYSALVLDSPFSSLRETIVDHSWLFLKMPRYPFPSLFLFWFKQIAGLDAAQVNSHEALQRVQPVPLLMITSEGDQRIRPEIARALYREARSPIKELKVFGKDVGHGAASRLHPVEYNDLLVNFLDRVIEEKRANGH